MTNINFRPYRDADRQACTSIFDANCPEFFAPNERQEYEEFLELVSGGYEVCEVDGKVLGAFGLFVDGENIKTLNWILLDPQTQGIGVGSTIMERVIQLSRTSQTRVVKIAASHKSAPFFARFGASTTSFTESGWAPGMDRVDMELTL
jgi:N-acetylglutamate synthase-like GNAT family acetyltransferase